MEVKGGGTVWIQELSFNTCNWIFSYYTFNICSNEMMCCRKTSGVCSPVLPACLWRERVHWPVHRRWCRGCRCLTESHNPPGSETKEKTSPTYHMEERKPWSWTTFPKPVDQQQTVLPRYHTMLGCWGSSTCCSTSGLSQGSTFTLYWGKSWTTRALWPWRIRLKMLRRPDMQTWPSAEINTWLALTLLHTTWRQLGHRDVNSNVTPLSYHNHKLLPPTTLDDFSC